MFRALVFWFGLVLITLLEMAAYFLAALLPRRWVAWKNEAQSALHRLWGRSILFFAGQETEITGTERLPEGPSVIVCNHASWLDVWFVFKHIRRHGRFSAKASLFSVPFFGWLMALSGHVKLTRGNRREDLAAIEKAKARVRRDNICVFWFPEGTRTPDGRLQPFKKGVYHFAKDMGLPVVPLVLRGSYASMPRNRWWPVRGKIRGTILEPVDAGAYPPNERDRFIADLETMFREQLANDVPLPEQAGAVHHEK